MRFILAALLFALSGLAAAAPPKGFDARVEALMKQQDLPGAAIAIVENGKVTLARRYGRKRIDGTDPVGADTLFQTGSTTKAFTAAALAILVDEGKIRWDDPVIEHLPGFRMYDPWVTREITIRDLLVHRSGLGRGQGDLLSGCSTVTAVNPVTLKKDFMVISEDTEISIGRKADPGIVQELGYYNDPSLQAYVNEVGQKLVQVCARRNIQYHFKVLDSPIENAFAVPGGYIYITRGLLALLNSEAELAGVLGHEIGHVVGRDSANLISEGIAMQLLTLGSAAAGPTGREMMQATNMLFNSIMLGYGREKEYLADAQGVDYMFKAGYLPTSVPNRQGGQGQPALRYLFVRYHPL